MTNKHVIDSPLKSRVIALPESRQLDVLAALFERRQAQVMRVPLVTILDASDQAVVIRWLQSFINNPPDYLILLTGEGLRRLRSTAERLEMSDAFVQALQRVQTLCRGPKPGRALNELGMKADIVAVSPTTAGIIETLGTLPITGKRLAVQLYGEDPNLPLMDYLQTVKLAELSVVAPYRYADNSEDEAVIRLIHSLAANTIDMIAFTSKPQIKRLVKVAKDNDLLEALQSGLQQALVAAVGPVVAQELQDHKLPVHVMPNQSYFMKPLVRSAELAFAEVTGS